MRIAIEKGTIMAASLLAVVVASVAFWFSVLAKDPLSDRWPVSLQAPLFVPAQSRFPVPLKHNQDAAEAKETWTRALNKFRSAPSDLEAVDQSAPLFREIWNRWPNSDVAIRAQFFYIETLGAYSSEEVELAHLQSVFEQALQSPQRYFTHEYQASTQSLSAQLIQTLLEENRASQAWALCVRLRWHAPRIDLLAPLCKRLLDEAPEVAMTPAATLNLLPPTVVLKEIPAEKLKLPLAKALQNYLTHPYNPDTLATASIELYKGGFKDISRQLFLEMLEIDPVKAPKIEIAIDKLENSKK